MYSIASCLCKAQSLYILYQAKITFNGKFTPDTLFTITIDKMHMYRMCQVLRVLIHRNAYLRDSRGRSWLYLACESINCNLVRFFVQDMHLSPLVVDNNGDTPLHVLCPACLLLCLFRNFT